MAEIAEMKVASFHDVVYVAFKGERTVTPSTFSPLDTVALQPATVTNVGGDDFFSHCGVPKNARRTCLDSIAGCSAKTSVVERMYI